jgi:RND family efflux transporter MFP subunit
MISGSRSIIRKAVSEIVFRAGLANLLPTLLCLALLPLTSCSTSGKERDDPKGHDAALPVRAVPVQVQEMTRTVESVGSLFPYEQVAVSSEVDGKCDKVLVDIGDFVKKGQVLVQISTVELQLAAEQQAAILEQARARLGLTGSAEEIRDPAEAAGVKKASADLKDAEQKFERAKELVDQNLLPRQSYEEAESHLKSSQAAYDLAVEDARVLQGALKQYQASSKLADKKVEDTFIRAPFSGYVKDRSVTEGQYVKAQSPIVTILNNDPLRARLAIPEKMAGWISVGRAVAISVEAFPDRSFVGKIWRIDPSVDSQTRSFQAEALVENKEGLLKPGFFVKAIIPSSKTERVLTVPNSSIAYNYGVFSVFVIKDNKLVQTEVKIGDRDKDQVEVSEGVTEGQLVAIASDEKELLRDGATIEIGEGKRGRGARSGARRSGRSDPEE